MQALRIGDTVQPEDTDATPLAGRQPPQWFITLATPTKDAGLAAYFDLIGAVEAWRPTVTKWKAARGPRKRVQYQASAAPGYVFVLVDRAPRWHIIRQQAGRLMRGVVGRHGLPMPIPEDVIASMQLVPGRIELLRKEALLRREAERLARMPRPGGKARLAEGPLAGFVVEVESIDRGVLHFICRGIKGIARIEDTERVEDGT
jgi:transcription antitermination factor NusG